MILSISEMEFAYNGTPVLGGVSFELGRGQILGVLGVNGAGKSTLLKCINKVLRPQKGTVFLNDENVLQMRSTDEAKHIGYVPQVA